ncbi:hypothetical protein C8R47DRAFT_1082418 [Mycena vitilis]|nr:hypothetical protein C8R47DRAFT_1082418 [Mycena vitilis]
MSYSQIGQELRVCRCRLPFHHRGTSLALGGPASRRLPRRRVDELSRTGARRPDEGGVDWPQLALLGKPVRLALASILAEQSVEGITAAMMHTSWVAAKRREAVIATVPCPTLVHDELLGADIGADPSRFGRRHGKKEPWPIATRANKAHQFLPLSMVYGLYIVDRLSLEPRESTEECTAIKRAWAARDRSKIKSYPQLLAARRLMEAALACSSAIANLRVAVRWPSSFTHWMNSGPPPPRIRTGGGSARGNAWGNGAGWGNGGWGNGKGWGNVQDPTWDGVTRVPKTPGKQRRRRQRLRQWREEQDARNAKWLEDCRLEMLRWLAHHPHLACPRLITDHQSSSPSSSSDSDACSGSDQYCRDFGRAVVAFPAAAFCRTAARRARWIKALTFIGSGPEPLDSFGVAPRSVPCANAPSSLCLCVDSLPRSLSNVRQSQLTDPGTHLCRYLRYVANHRNRRSSSSPHRWSTEQGIADRDLRDETLSGAALTGAYFTKPIQRLVFVRDIFEQAEASADVSFIILHRISKAFKKNWLDLEICNDTQAADTYSRPRAVIKPAIMFVCASVYALALHFQCVSVPHYPGELPVEFRSLIDAPGAPQREGNAALSLASA